MGSMASKIPRGEERGIDVGDISFVGQGDRIMSIAFTRNNIMTIVRSVGDLDVTVEPFAKMVDNSILSKDQKTKSKNAPIISAFNISTNQMTTGGKVKLSFSAVDPRLKIMMFKLFTTAGPISRNDDDFIVECKKIGSHKVKLYAINDDGLASTSELDLTVK